MTRFSVLNAFDHASVLSGCHHSVRFQETINSGVFENVIKAVNDLDHQRISSNVIFYLEDAANPHHLVLSLADVEVNENGDA